MTFKAYKKLLGVIADDMKDEEIEKLFMLQSQLADLIIEKWVREKTRKRETPERLPSSDDNDIISPHV